MPGMATCSWQPTAAQVGGWFGGVHCTRGGCIEGYEREGSTRRRSTMRHSSTSCNCAVHTSLQG
jgi:hypothetical protein